MQQTIFGNLVGNLVGSFLWNSGSASKARSKTRLAGVMAALLVAAAESKAQGSHVERPARPHQELEARTAVERRIVVSIPDRKLAVIEDGKVVKIYRIAVGAKDSPSPAGEFKIINRISQPTYYAPGLIIPADEDNPLGPRWIGLNFSHLGIHGTNQPHSIGRYASHGCIRMRNADVEDLFGRVRVGDTVVLSGERSEEIARIFGGAPAVVRIAAARAEPAKEPPTEASGDFAPDQKVSPSGQQE